jgi:hypothetical protein
LNNLIKKAYDAKGNAINVMKGDLKHKLPLDIFLSGIINDIITYSLSVILEITMKDPESYNYVTGYNIIADCLWPLVLQNLES